MNCSCFRPFVWGAGLLVVVLVGLGALWYRTHPAAKEDGPDVEANAGPRSLPEEDRKFLWQVEHHALALKQYGLKPLAQALEHADAAALEAFLSPGFEGQVLTDPREIQLTADFVEVSRQEEVDGHARQTLTPSQFVARLLEYRRRFAKPPKIDTAVMRLSPEVHDKLDGLWKGECQLRLYGQSAAEPAGPAEVVLYLEYRVAQPTAKNLARGWLHAAAIRQAQAGRAPHYLLKEVALERGIDARLFYDNWTRGPNEQLIPNAGGVYLCDFDHDGYLDVLITDVRRFALYKGLPGGKFTDVTSQVGLPDHGRITLAAAFVDIDGDGWEDLILDNRTFHNVPDGNGGRRFVAVPTNLHLPENVSGIIVLDYNCDGLMDLYVTRHGQETGASWVTGQSGSPWGNQLWQNRGNGVFEDVTDEAHAAAGHRSTFTAACLDANNDGWPDLYVINEFGNGVLLLNNRDGTFREHDIHDGRPDDFGTMGVAVGDIDNDNQIDIYCCNMYSKAGSRVMGNVRPDAYSPDVMARMRRFVTGSQLHRNRGGGRFDQQGHQFHIDAVGWSYGAALVDLDNDGWLDIYATCGYVSQDRVNPDG